MDSRTGVHTSDEIYEAIAELRERVARLEQRVDTLTAEIREIREIKTDVVATKQRVEDIDKKLDNFIALYMKQQVSNHKLLKWFAIILGLFLSFLAAVLGLDWRPP